MYTGYNENTQISLKQFFIAILLPIFPIISETIFKKISDANRGEMTFYRQKTPLLEG